MAEVLDKLRRQHKSELLELVKMHLSFLIDVTTEEWERIVAYVDKEEAEHSGNLKPGKNSQTKYFTSSTSSESCNKIGNGKFAPPKEKELASNIFGTPLTPQSLSQVMILVDFLNEDDNYKLEGIFRKSGTQERQQDLRYMLNNGVKVDLKANRFTPVDVSCVLKEFIQKLPEPLLTTNHFELHYQLALTIRRECTSDDVEAKNNKRLKIIQLLLHLMPELNRNLFVSLMALLDRVARSLEVTKMDERSLATIFGAHLLCPRTWTPKQIQKEIDLITDAMEFLLANYDKLFNGPQELVLDARRKLKKHQKQALRLNGNVSGGDELDGTSEDRLIMGASADDDEGDENNTVITFCQRKQSQETITEQALAELYAQVQAMPETPQKKKLIKKLNQQNGFGTPMHVTNRHSTSSKWKSLIPPILRPKH